jgi:hypothetical protein
MLRADRHAAVDPERDPMNADTDRGYVKVDHFWEASPAASPTETDADDKGHRPRS